MKVLGRGIAISDSVKLYAVLLLSRLIPALYSTFRIYLIGDVPDVGAYSIASQISWLSLVIEVINDGILLPLFYVFGRYITKPDAFSSVVSVAFRWIGGAFILLSTFLLIFAPHLVTAMGQTPELHEITVTYIRGEIIAMTFSYVFTVAMIVLTVLGRTASIMMLLIAQAVCMSMCDALMFGTFDFSFGLGIVGVAISSIVSNIILALYAIYILNRCGVSLLNRNRLDPILKRSWLRISILASTETLVRNGAFAVMIIRIVNTVHKQGEFWLANAFIWGWLLLPILSLGDFVRRQAAVKNGYVGAGLFLYFVSTMFICALWFATFSYWGSFLQNVMGVSDPGPVIDVVNVLIGFYVVFAFNNIVDSFFYGTGRTDLMLYQSLFVNVIYYGVAFVLYQNGYFQPDIYSICLLFGGGIVVDAILTFVLFVWISVPQYFRAGSSAGILSK